MTFTTPPSFDWRIARRREPLNWRIRRAISRWIWRLTHPPRYPGDDHAFDPAFCREDVHEMFGLTYASYLVWPRVLMQEMPPEWQHRLAQLESEMSMSFRAPLEGTYAVLLRNSEGRYTHDPLSKYRHPYSPILDRARRVYGKQDSLGLR